MFSTAGRGKRYTCCSGITRDPREEMNVVGTEAWVIGACVKIVGAYQASIKDYPNPKGLSLTIFPK